MIESVKTRKELDALRKRRDVVSLEAAREEKGFDIITGEVILRIVRADAKIARMLDVSRNTPLLGTWGRVFRGDGQLLHVCNQIGYGENFEFIVR